MLPEAGPREGPALGRSQRAQELATRESRLRGTRGRATLRARNERAGAGPLHTREARARRVLRPESLNRAPQRGQLRLESGIGGRGAGHLRDMRPGARLRLQRELGLHAGQGLRAGAGVRLPVPPGGQRRGEQFELGRKRPVRVTPRCLQAGRAALAPGEARVGRGLPGGGL